MKRFLSMLLCAAMLISLVPAAWAEEAGQELLAEQPVEEQVEQPPSGICPIWILCRIYLCSSENTLKKCLRYSALSLLSYYALGK